MRDIVMIELKAYEIFKDSVATLKEVSLDTEHGESMLNDTVDVINFDRVKRKYTNQLGHSENDASSVDALAYNEDTLFFIEFKNGQVKNNDIKNKIKDSLLIFNDIVQKNISYTRKCTELIIVYNLESNPMPHQYEKKNSSDSALIGISKHVAKLAGKEFIRFNTERYQSLYFKAVHTYTVSEFKLFMQDAKIQSV